MSENPPGGDIEYIPLLHISVLLQLPLTVCLTTASSLYSPSCAASRLLQSIRASREGASHLKEQGAKSIKLKVI